MECIGLDLYCLLTIFQNNFQFLPLHFLYFEKKGFKGFF